MSRAPYTGWDPDPLHVEPDPPHANRDNPLLWFAGILAIGAVAGWALGNDLRVSAGLYAALVASFGVGLWCGREERDAS